MFGFVFVFFLFYRQKSSDQNKDYEGRVVKINTSFLNDGLLSFCNNLSAPEWCCILLQKNQLTAVRCSSQKYYFCEKCEYT